MKNLLPALLLLPLLTFAAPKLNRAMVFSGGGLQSAIFLGMLEGASEKGIEPDVVIGTCGAGIAMAIIQAFPTHNERRAFIETKEYFNFVREVKLKELTGLQLITAFGTLAKNVKERRAAKFEALTIPDIFSSAVMLVPDIFPFKPLNKTFTSTSNTIRTVIVANKVLFDKTKSNSQLKKGEKLFRQVFFTDQETALYLKQFKSPIALDPAYPDNHIDIETQTLSDITLAEAARISITDPGYINPIVIKDTYYLGGSVDLYPIEVAYAIADKVIMTYSGFFSQVEEDVIYTHYGYSNNELLKKVHEMEAEHWIDFTDNGPLYKSAGFNPTLAITGFKNGIPTTHDEFVKKLRLQWEYGKANGAAAMETDLNDKSHIFLRHAK